MEPYCRLGGSLVQPLPRPTPPHCDSSAPSLVA